MSLTRSVVGSLLALLAVVSWCPAEEVLFVGEEGAGPFRDCAATIRKTLGQAGVSSTMAWTMETARQSPPTLPGGLKLIVALGTEAALWAREHRASVPAMFAMVLNPTQNVVKSPDTPPPGFTGVCLDLPARAVMRAVRRLLPHVHRLGVLHNPAENSLTVQEVPVAAAESGLVVVVRAVPELVQLQNALDATLPEVDLIWPLPDSEVLSPLAARKLLEASMKRKVPTLGFSRSMAAAGALLTVVPDFGDSALQAGELALKVLRGPATASRPILRPRRVLVLFNRRVAQLLGVSVPAEDASEVSEWIR